MAVCELYSLYIHWQATDGGTGGGKSVTIGYMLGTFVQRLFAAAA